MAGSTATNPFVGREEEMRILSDALADATVGAGHVVMIGGEPGIGKTRCAEELAERAQSEGVTVLRGYAYELEGAPPAWPWIDALNLLASGMDERSLQAIACEIGMSLSELLPVVHSYNPAVNGETTVRNHSFGFSRESEQFKIQLAVSEFLRLSSESGPLLLVLEDLHWADTQTLRILDFVAARISTAHILVVGTFRLADFGWGAALTQTLGAMTRYIGCIRLELHGLHDEDVRTYLRMIYHRDATETEVTGVMTRTDGNPFFVREVAYVQPGDNVPRTVREFIGRRIAALSQPCAAMLRTAALLGREITVDAIAGAIAGSTTTEVAKLMDEAVSANLLVETSEGSMRFCFTHALIQEAMVAAMSPGEGARRHGDIARALESQYGAQSEEHATEVLHHIEAAGALIESEVVVRYALAAGEAALALRAFEEAARCFHVGLSAKGDGPLDDESAALWFGLARSHNDEYGAKKSVELMRGAAETFDYYAAAGDWPRAVVLASVVGRGPSTGGYGGKRIMVQALEHIGEETDEARLRCVYARMLKNQYGDAATGNEEFGKAVALAREQNDTGLVQAILADWAQSNVITGEFEECRKHLAEARTLSAVPDLFVRRNLLAAEEDLLFFFGSEPDHVLDLHEEMYRIAVATHVHRATTAYSLGWLYYGRGDFDTALRYAHESYHYGDSDGFHCAPALRTMLEFERGNATEGAAAAEELMGLATARGLPVGWDYFMCFRYIPEVTRKGADPGLLNEIQRMALETKNTLREDHNPRYRHIPDCALAHIAAIRGNSRRSAELYDHLLSIPDGEGPGILFLSQGLLGLAAAAATPGGGESAGRHDAGPSTDVPPGGAGSASRESAARELRRAGLTPREVEVLEQLATGRTNREIGSELYISEKTVHSHLYSIYEKLGVTNRTEAARAALRLGVVEDP